MNLHLFNPENDLALGLNLENYTAPPAASALARAGSTLPIWYGEKGDMFASEGVNAAWLRSMHDAFGPGVSPWDHNAANLRPKPWGWSKAARRSFRMMGFDADMLPDEASLARIRELSSRESACRIGAQLAHEGLQPEEWAAQRVNNTEEALRYSREHGDVLLKLPWSSSGRGQIRICGMQDFAMREQGVAGAIRRYGFLTAEPFHRNKAVDLAHLFEAKAGRVSYAGLSLFATEANGDYAGNALAPESQLRAMLENRFQGVCAKLDDIAEAQRRILETMIGTDYEGPMGVDMMILSDGSIAGSVELNLRMTMGHVARRFHDRYCAEGACGIFRLENNATGRHYSAGHSGGRLTGGTLRLNPPEYGIAFVAEIKGEEPSGAQGFQFV